MLVGLHVREVLLGLILGTLPASAAGDSRLQAPLPKIRVAGDGRSFVSENGKAFAPVGVTYYRPGTGWPPQLWKKFHATATRQDFARMKELGVNCVRVFLSYGSFFRSPDKLDAEGLARFDQFLALAEEAGIYVHPTGPDHWEGTPAWAQTDRIADQRLLAALENFWRAFARRYRGRPVIFAYDLRNEPEVAWDNDVLRTRWNAWLKDRYGSSQALAGGWKVPLNAIHWGSEQPPPARDALGNRQLLDYQHFREDVADEWTRRQATAIRSEDPGALVTVGLVQWSIPAPLGSVRQYSGFRPRRQAQFLDFVEIHFYPLASGFYAYENPEAERSNLAYLEMVLREIAAGGKPVVLAEFGWYGGGRLTIDGGRHPGASEDQQAGWCRRVVTSSRGLTAGWLNWGLYDHPEARDVSQLSGLLTSGGRPKTWGREFQQLARTVAGQFLHRRSLGPRPKFPWDHCFTSAAWGRRFLKEYTRALARSATNSLP